MCEAPIETGGKEWMRVPYGEGLASSTGPKLCAVGSNASSEALAGGTCRPGIESRNLAVLGCRRAAHQRKTTSSSALSQVLDGPHAVADPVHLHGNLSARESGEPYGRLRRMAMQAALASLRM